ncbi:enoyl-CoA hydratase [Lederbergia lenta]|uniref:Enoyl-CoA hydratase/isomerase n=1 Tax=Lederbergia lenta TaxID=1467 RepID=A0A2X4WN01_LEDLE|nr:enoyl-CoA hydratase [Lederbergia lenta]MCM3110528.1 enoyl-CoA hydratase [Lederbergia lenta]MEC2323906.1 enoyl-CoA hydratase [Lederbergia lenta]SQI61048.1 enoyl-CoA hydratase/isomerase [Lederbergia lenta]
MEGNLQTIHLAVKGKVAYITLNRPKSLNAMNVLMMNELDHCFKHVRKDKSIKIVILQGKSENFSAGGDIKEMLQIDGEQEFYSVMDKIHSIIMTFYRLPQVTLAAVDGAAAGLGLSLALAADYVICSQEAKIAMNFIGIGLIPDGGGHFFMEERIGTNKAKQLIWEGKTMDALQAMHIGLIDETVEDLSEAIDHRITLWLEKPLLAMSRTKEIYTELNREKLQKTLELEKQAQWLVRRSKDHREGIQAFVEKRRPMFKGE